MINPIDMATRRRGIILLLALVGLLAAQQAKEVAAQQQEEVSIIVIIQTCLDLDTAIQEAATTTTTTTLGTTPVVSFDLADSITCDGHITISSGQNITIRNSGTTGDITTTITIAADFVANSSSQSLLHVQEGGTLTLDGINFDQQAGGLLPAEGVRAVYNRGTLTVNNCAFNGLNSVAVELLSQGGAIYTDSEEQEVIISGSKFTANLASQRGGAICAVGTDLLSVDGCAFESNEVISQTLDTSGGDIFAISGVALVVADSTFAGSTAQYGGAAIECCGAVITNCNFDNTDAASEDEHFGALLVGRRGQAECPHELVLANSSFTTCVVSPTAGAGGSLAIFDTSATITECTFEKGQGTAVLFESSSPNGSHTISMESSIFQENTRPADKYAHEESPQGVAMVVLNTGLSEADERVFMGEFDDIYCFGNSPFECEFVLDMAGIDMDGDFKCQLCNLEGESVSSTDASEETLEPAASGSGTSTDSRSDLIIGLSSALGGLVLFLVGVVAWKCCRKNNTPSAGGAQGRQSEPAATAQQAGSAEQPPFTVAAQPSVAVQSSSPAVERSPPAQPPAITETPPTVEAPPAAQTTAAPAANTVPAAAPSLPIVPTAAQSSPTLVERSSSARSPPTAESPSAADDAPPPLVAQTKVMAEALSPPQSPPPTAAEAPPAEEAAPAVQADLTAQSPPAAAQLSTAV